MGCIFCKCNNNPYSDAETYLILVINEIIKINVLEQYLESIDKIIPCCNFSINYEKFEEENFTFRNKSSYESKNSIDEIGLSSKIDLATANKMVVWKLIKSCLLPDTQLKPFIKKIIPRNCYSCIEINDNTKNANLSNTRSINNSTISIFLFTFSFLKSETFSNQSKGEIFHDMLLKSYTSQLKESKNKTVTTVASNSNNLSQNSNNSNKPLGTLGKSNIKSDKSKVERLKKGGSNEYSENDDFNRKDKRRSTVTFRLPNQEINKVQACSPTKNNPISRFSPKKNNNKNIDSINNNFTINNDMNNAEAKVDKNNINNNANGNNTNNSSNDKLTQDSNINNMKIYKNSEILSPIKLNKLYNEKYKKEEPNEFDNLELSSEYIKNVLFYYSEIIIYQTIPKLIFELISYSESIVKDEKRKKVEESNISEVLKKLENKELIDELKYLAQHAFTMKQVRKFYEILLAEFYSHLKSMKVRDYKEAFKSIETFLYIKNVISWCISTIA